jgi:DNA adenine methylase
MMGQIERPAFRYFGGKWILSPWIISHFPEHINYVELCGGAGSILIQKERSPIETFNDLDGEIVNFFQVLRMRRDELIEQIRFTPWARAEYQLSCEPVQDELERARRFYMRHQMAISASRRYSSGMRMVKGLDGGIPARYHANVDHLYQIAERFMGVQIEQLSALKCVEKYETPETLFYFDPPYVIEKRTSGKEYVFEIDTQFHVEAATLLRESAGYVVVSGYACPLYADLYETRGWQRVDIEAQTSGQKRTESLWLNPKTVEALKPKEVDYQLSLIEAAQ